MERCRSYQELLSLSLDQPLTPADQNALDRHLSQCSQCRALSRQLGQIHNELALWPEEDVPAGFADGVMDRIRADAAPKVVPLWKRPQIKALAALAACALVCAGLWRGSLSAVTAETEGAPAVLSDSSPEFSTEPGEIVEKDSLARAALSEEELAPDGAALARSVADALGEEPGTLLIYDKTPQALEDAQDWRSTKDGCAFLVLDPEAEGADTLEEQPLLRLDLGDGPCVVFIWKG